MADWEEWVKKIQRAHAAIEESDYYTLLSVARDADLETIRKAYYARARQLHPDRVRDVPEPTRSQAIALFKRMAEAYRTLTDQELRRVYDEGLLEGKKRLIITSRLTIKPKSELDMLSTEAGKRFFTAAKEAFLAGNMAQAKLNLSLALQYEGPKPPILELQRKLG